ncbi:RHS repeat domain-containing protein [Variovorax sp. Root434]|uniref:RHS repeat domain-containing protein n=1 Tax=Variovorax sp. Root434 TaxID=1736536 RepID=UPI0022866786|nr:RHS repeat-associated core domain-containing protein [Variovorax sp. Root434]
MPIAAVINGAIYAVHSDHLNTPRRLTNADGQAVWQWTYSAFGEDKPTTAGNRFANKETTPNPGTTGTAEVKFNLRYPGQYADEESGLFYNYFRSYDPKTGRYPQSDPIGLLGGGNRYLYANGSSLIYTDPYGLWPTLDDIGFLTPKKAASAADYWAGKQNETGNWGYAIPGMAAALVADYYDTAMMAMCSVRGVGAAKGGLAEARSARDALAAELAPLGSKAPATVTGGYNVKTGDVAARACSGGKCAEDHVVDALGGAKGDVRFSEAIRPRTGREVPVCPRCEANFGRSPFPRNTRFKSDE